MRNQLQLFWDQSLNIMGLSYAVKKSFWKCFLFKLDNYYGEFYLCLTNSFIHPRNITGNIYHSLYHIIRFKSFQKNWVWGIAKIKIRFCVSFFKTAQEYHSDGIFYLLWARKCRMLFMIGVHVIHQNNSRFNIEVTRGTVYQVSTKQYQNQVLKRKGTSRCVRDND